MDQILAVHAATSRSCGWFSTITPLSKRAAALARRHGADVIDLDRQPTAGGDGLVVDLADEASIDAAVAALPGRIDALCNVAGVPGTQSAPAVIGVNLLGLRHLTEALRPRLRGGAVVNVASTAGSGWASMIGEVDGLLATGSITEGLAWYATASPATAAYNLSKAAVIVWTMRTAWAWREDGPRLNSVSPGPVDTPILGDFRSSMGPVVDRVSEAVGRTGRPEEIAPAVCFLADPASSWVNGANLVADGGFEAAVNSGMIDLRALAQGG